MTAGLEIHVHDAVNAYDALLRVVHLLDALNVGGSGRSGKGARSSDGRNNRRR